MLYIYIYIFFFVLLYSDYSVSILTTEDSAPLRSRAIRRLVELVGSGRIALGVAMWVFAVLHSLRIVKSNFRFWGPLMSLAVTKTLFFTF